MLTENPLQHQYGEEEVVRGGAMTLVHLPVRSTVQTLATQFHPIKSPFPQAFCLQTEEKD